MALGKRKSASHELDCGYLSDESDFYGKLEYMSGELMVLEFEARAVRFSATKWWGDRIQRLNDMVTVDTTSTNTVKTVTLYNPYADQTCGRQLSETVDEFLERLPPATTPVSHEIPWIFIANPYQIAPSFLKYGKEKEGPPKFKVLGGQLLEDLSRLKEEIEEKGKVPRQAGIAKVFSVERGIIVAKILDAAVKINCSSGKWMLFCPTADVNNIWTVVAHETANNDLGIAAKVAPYDAVSRKERVIGIYTKDFTDIKDITRVLNKLRSLGLFSMRGKPLYYKCDAFSYLNIDSKNEWGIKASLYNSAEILDPNYEREVGEIIGFGR